MLCYNRIVSVAGSTRRPIPYDGVVCVPETGFSSIGVAVGRPEFSPFAVRGPQVPALGPRKEVASLALDRQKAGRKENGSVRIAYPATNADARQRNRTADEGKRIG